MDCGTATQSLDLGVGHRVCDAICFLAHSINPGRGQIKKLENS
jgi:hypothetical protein